MAGQRHRVRRRREFSQHFLRSRGLAASLVAQSSISSRDLVVEIGPGRGILTRELAERCSHLVAVELDHQLFARLRDAFCDPPHVELVHRDFLRFTLPDTPYKVFGNIPFSQTAAIVRRLVDAPTPPDDVYCVVQREAGQRFAGGPHAPETLPSLLLKPWWQAEVARQLRRTDFDPPPRVYSVLLWLARRPRPLVDPSQRTLYHHFVTASFGRRGNTVRRCLGGLFTSRQIGRLAMDLSFNAPPPSTLSFDQWLAVFRYLVVEQSAIRQTRLSEAFRR